MTLALCQNSLFSSAARMHGLSWCVLLSMCITTGCQRWPGSQAMKQYQVESDRLLAEFRSQKKRADELEQRNSLLEQRLAESEKLLARVQGNSSNRLGSRTAPSTGITIGEPLLSNRESSRNNLRPSRPGLPDASPPTPGYLTSGIGSGGTYGDNRDSRDLRGDPSKSAQWRPIR